jgi:tetratricopeptide (TPR) repeat protein
MNFNWWKNLNLYILASILTLVIVAQNGCALKGSAEKSTGLFFGDAGTFATEEEALFRGWEYFKNKKYEKASVIFNYLIENGKEKTKEDSLAGLGWVNLRAGESKTALQYFEKAQGNLYSTVGMAVYYLINNGDGKYISEVISNLQTALKEKDFTQLKEFFGIEEAQLDALLGYFYALNGNSTLAVSYGTKAKELDEKKVRDILDSISTITGVEL